MHSVVPPVSNFVAVDKDSLDWVSPFLLSMDVLIAECTTGCYPLVEVWLCIHMFLTSLPNEPPAFCKVA